MFGFLKRLVEHTRKHWQARCLTCERTFPYPGIRIGAAGRPVKLMRCPHCGRLRICRAEPIEGKAG